MSFANTALLLWAYKEIFHNFDYGNNDQQTNLLGQDHYNAI